MEPENTYLLSLFQKVSLPTALDMSPVDSSVSTTEEMDEELNYVNEKWMNH